MLITSVSFILFLTLVLGIYYKLSRSKQNAWLLFMSYIFIITWDWKFAVTLGVVTSANFVLALKLRENDQGRKGSFWAGIGFNVFVLIFFRTMNFFLPGLETLLTRFGVQTQAAGLQILIPLGLSFYVLQTISYLVDVYRGQLDAEKSWIDFALYLAYFPKIIAGPIERARSFLPRLSRSRVVDNQVIARSLSLIFVGIFRKLLIADLLTGLFLLDVFELPAKYTPPELIIWLVIYAFALYNDFAGYTNIVRGISGLFGIELSANFNAPYFSRNFTEFWNRWHITLSEWLRDYIYFPVSRFLGRHYSGHRIAKLVFPPMVTMVVSGIWHGFSLHMILWGGLHGLYQIIERIPSLWRPIKSPQAQPIWRQGLSIITVFALVILAWVPFKWELPTALDFWGALLNWSSMAVRYNRLYIAIPILLESLVIDFLQYKSQDEYIYLQWPRFVKAACMAIIIVMVFIITGDDFGEPFVYQAF